MTGAAPRLAPGARLHHDRVRARTVLLLPERVVLPDERALAVLERVDGRSAAAIVEQVASLYGAPPAVVREDVHAFLSELEALGAVAWDAP